MSHRSGPGVCAAAVAISVRPPPEMLTGLTSSARSRPGSRYVRHGRGFSTSPPDARVSWAECEAHKKEFRDEQSVCCLGGLGGRVHHRPRPQPGVTLGIGGDQLFDCTGTAIPERPVPELSALGSQRPGLRRPRRRVGAVVAAVRLRRLRWLGRRRSASHRALFVLSHRPAPPGATRQTFVGSGISDAIAAATRAAGSRDVALMGSGASLRRYRPGWWTR